MATSPFVKPLGITAALLGIVQGVAWSILTIMVILIHTEAWVPSLPEKDEKHSQALSAAFVDYIIGSGSFFGWSISYLILSIVWVCLSSFLWRALTNQIHGQIKYLYFGWVIWTAIVCLCDLILTSLFAKDYESLLAEFEHSFIREKDKFYAVLLYGILMTIAARGFVLWVINLILAELLLKLWLDFSKKVQ